MIRLDLHKNSNKLDNLAGSLFLIHCHITPLVKETDLQTGTFDISNSDKIKKHAASFSETIRKLKPNLTNNGLCSAPYRFAKMFIKQLFYSLNLENSREPLITKINTRKCWSSKMYILFNILICDEK